FEKYAGTLTPTQRAAVDTWLPQLKPGGSASSDAASRGAFGVGIDTVDVMRKGNSESLVSFYAAGIGVMFLLFSVSGASGSLLDEVGSGTLDRVLSTRVGMSGLLTGKWLFISLLGMLQLTVMFLWGRLAFGLDLFHHLPGFVVMTAFTAAAAAGFGLMLATHPRTALRHVDDRHPDDVVARRQHVPALPDERDDAEARAADVQRVGARRLPEGVLARRGDLASLAAGAGAGGADRRLPGPGADVRAEMGDGVARCEV